LPRRGRANGFSSLKFHEQVSYVVLEDSPEAACELNNLRTFMAYRDSRETFEDQGLHGPESSPTIMRLRKAEQCKRMLVLSNFPLVVFADRG
jgi:hypothetical protein